ncbi:hypothetical protein IWQ61_003036 [Dispira simplex]|nr:hypothetical protein IWQ61_003036 [Dispira simplex]
MARRPVVYIVYYSMYGHVAKLAQLVKQGVEKVADVDVKLFQIKETLSDEVLTKMHAPPKSDIPVLEPKDMVEADGILFGIPTRYGTMPAQWKHFWDATGQLWAKGALTTKMAGTFFSTSSQHGGQETTALTMLTTFSHHGIIYVPMGYTHPNLQDNSEVIGGSAYGAGTVAGGDGSRQISPKEEAIAIHQGEYFAKIVKQYVTGASHDLASADGFLFGVRTRYGHIPEQWKTFLDSTGALRARGTLSGKFASGFFSTTSQHGGQKTTIMNLFTFSAHHGIAFVPLGYRSSYQFDTSQAVGGSVYGAGTISHGDGSRAPSREEHQIAVAQGYFFAQIIQLYG